MANSNGKKKIVGRAVRFVVALLLIALGFWLRGLFVPDKPVAGGEHTSHQQAGPDEPKAVVWTCSMHPTVRRPKPGLCPICNMELIPAADEQASGMGGMRELAVSETAAKLMDIETVPVERRAVTATVRMVGKVEYDETRLAYITAWIPGRLDRLFVDYTGVPVKKGDHMVLLYSPALLTAQEELLQAIKAIDNMKDSNLAIMRETTAATLKAAREKLGLWGLNAEQIAQIERSGQVSDHMTIYAPAGGIVIHKNALEGMYVKEGTRIYTIADLSKVWVKLDAYESDLEWLRYGQTVEFTTVAYPGEAFTGTIAFIDPVLDARTRTAKVRVNVANADGKLKPEMFVKAVARAQIAAGGRVMDAALAGKWICPMHPEIIKSESGTCDICEMPLVTTESLGYVSEDVASARKALVIPVSAALVTGTRAVVYVQKTDQDKPTFEGREIVLGPRAGSCYLVRSGLQEGELVVVKGNFKIDSALQILAKPSMMTPGGGAAGGGHDHGGHAQAGDGQGGAGRQGVELGALTRYQLGQVLQAGRKVAKAIAEHDLVAVKKTFADLKRALDTVDMEQMAGHTHMLWMDLSMRLNNDAVEGAGARTMKEAERVGRVLAGNLERLQATMGLAAEAPSRPVLSKELRGQIRGVYEGYFAMQGALANDDAKETMAAAERTAKSLEAVDTTLFDGASEQTWLETSGQLRPILAGMAKADDIKVFREGFYLASQHMIALARAFGAAGPAIYIMHCPMAFDNRGAKWVQDNADLRNPYFGAAMLKCGSVEDVVSGEQPEP